MPIRVSYEEGKLLKEAARRRDANKLLSRADFIARRKSWLRSFGVFHAIVTAPILITFFVWSEPIGAIVCLYSWPLLTIIGYFVATRLADRWDNYDTTVRKEYGRLEQNRGNRPGSA